MVWLLRALTRSLRPWGELGISRVSPAGEDATAREPFATSIPTNKDSDMGTPLSCEYELDARGGRRRLKRLFGFIPRGRRGSRFVTASRARAQSISRRPPVGGLPSPLEALPRAVPMEPYFPRFGNIQGHRDGVGVQGSRFKVQGSKSEIRLCALRVLCGEIGLEIIFGYLLKRMVMMSPSFTS